MPEYVFAGPYPTTYPEGRDAEGQNLGQVDPGQIRNLDAAPDQYWREATDEDRARLAAEAVEHPADGTWSPPVSNEPGPGEAPGEPVTQALDGPQPVPPAVIPGA